MIAEHEASDKFQVITQMGVGILDLKAQIKTLTAQLEGERARADKAESRVCQLEARLTQPKKEAFTLSLPIANPEDRVKADLELAKKINDGWERFDSAYIGNSGERTIHYITLVRAIPIPAEPDQPAATVAVAKAPTKPAPAATPDPAPEANPDALPVTRKTVTATAILEPGQTPAADEADPPAGESSPVEPSQRGEEIKATAQQAYNDALARNPLPANRPLSSFKSVQGSAP